MDDPQMYLWNIKFGSRWVTRPAVAGDTVGPKTQLAQGAAGYGPLQRSSAARQHGAWGCLVEITKNLQIALSCSTFRLYAEMEVFWVIQVRTRLRSAFVLLCHLFEAHSTN